MRKIISLFISVIMLCTSMSITVVAENSNAQKSIEADKTAQWKNNSNDAEQDLRIHGWKGWETAAYIGFTLPEDFDFSTIKKSRTAPYNRKRQ